MLVVDVGAGAVASTRSPRCRSLRGPGIHERAQRPLLITHTPHMQATDSSVEVVGQSSMLQAPLLAGNVIGSDPSFRDEVVMAGQVVAGAPAAAVAQTGPPPAMAMWPGRSMSVGETIISGSRVFQSVPKNGCCDECKLCCCPCCPSVEYRASAKHGGLKLSFNNPCTWCCCDWRAQLAGSTIGDMSLPGCCDNGCLHCMCPSCICSGTYSILNFKVDGRTKYSLRKKLYCCWCPIEACATLWCLPCIGCCNECTQCPCDACAYCSNNNAVVVEEAVFPAMGQGDSQIGAIRMIETIAFKPGTCIPQRTLASFAVRFNGHSIGSHNDTLLLGLLPMMWRGLETSGCCPSVAPIRKPSADSCLNGGRIVNEQYMKFNEAMALTENPIDKLADELGVEVSTTGRLGQVSAETMAPKPVPAADMER